MVSVSTRRFVWFLRISIGLHALMYLHESKADLSTLARNDPYPVYTAIDPQEFLYTWDTLHMKGMPTEVDPDCSQLMSLSISPFFQNACGGKDQCGAKVPLGDLNGRWDMIGLLMGPLPQNQTFPPVLANAFANLFPLQTPGNLYDPNIIDPNRTFGFFSVPLKYQKRGLRWEFSGLIWCDMGFMFQGGVVDINQCVQAFDNLTCVSCPAPSPCNGPSPTVASTNPTAAINTGTFAQPIVPCNACDGTPIFYTNQNGLNVPVSCCNRFTDTSINCCGRFVPVAGVAGLTSPSASITSCCQQVPNTAGATPGTCPSCPQLSLIYPNLNANNVNQYLMNNLKVIAQQIGLDICNFRKFSLEDLRFYFFWRRAHIVNKGRAGWPEFLFTPYLQVGASVPTGPIADSNVAFSIPFGNNGHGSMGANGGFNIDFTDTIEIGIDFGLTGFFARDFCNYRVPNQVPDRKCQSGISPFRTNVRICPGLNWQFGAKMFAYHFLDRLSCWVQYYIVQHEHDRVSLQNPDPAFAPEVLEQLSKFQIQVLNAGFYYDISPTVALGVFFQIPLTQRRAYKSSTFLFSLWGSW